MPEWEKRGVRGNVKSLSASGKSVVEVTEETKTCGGDERDWKVTERDQRSIEVGFGDLLRDCKGMRDERAREITEWEEL